jgi:septum formation topological specificity factor MinE
MEIIYTLIQQNPQYYTWAFGIINVLWGGFLYFNKQSHERKLKHLEQDIKYGFDRRLKIFDLKASQYSQYVTDLDSLGKKNQVEIPAKMQPIFQTYFKEYLDASESGDTQRENEVIAWFGSEIQSLMNEGLKDVMKLKYESNRLKLIATDEMLVTFEAIEKLNQEIFDVTSEYMSNFTDIVINQKEDETARFQTKAASLGAELQKYSHQLLSQMRKEIVEI